MNTITHVVSASYIALRVANVAPNEFDYMATAVVSAGVLDIDHLVLMYKQKDFFKEHGYKGNLHLARSRLHELTGIFVVGLVMFVLSFINFKLALVVGLPAMIHLIQDMLVGISMTFNPIDTTTLSIIPQTKLVRATLDISLLILFGALWIKYLNVGI